MGTEIIVAILVLICVYSGYSYYRKLRVGGGCCGEHEAPEARVKVADRDTAHYPFTTLLTIDGMTCSNCVRRVENALNRMDGVWATVDFEHRCATVRSKLLLDEQELRDTINNIGYTVMKVE